MPTDLPPDYKPQPAPGPDSTPPMPGHDTPGQKTPGQGTPGEGAPGNDTPGIPGVKPAPGPDVVSPLPSGVPSPAGLPTF